MKKAITLIVAIFVVFAFTTVSFAGLEEEPKEPAEKKAEPATSAEKPKPKVKQVTGEVKAVDAVAKTITVAKKVKDKVEETIVTITDKTKIILDKEKKTLADVKVGDKVTVRYAEANGKKVAKRVTIKIAATSAEKK